MSRIKTSIIPLRAPSQLPDIKCCDGEVETFSNIPWLRDETDKSYGSAVPGQGANQGGSNAKSILVPELHAAGSITFPPSSTLIGLHSPPGSGCVYHFFVTSRGQLGYTSPGAATIYPAGYSRDTAGAVTCFLPYGNTVILICEKGISYLLYDDSSKTWDFSPSLPDAPEVTASASPALLPGYVHAAGNYPSVNLRIQLPSPGNVSEEIIGKWLGGENPDAIGVANAQKITGSLLEALKKYVKDTMNAGKFLWRPRIFATLSRTGADEYRFPSSIFSFGANAPEIKCVVDDYSLWNGTLILKVHCTLLPLEVSVSVSLPESCRKWRRFFPYAAVFVENPGNFFPESYKANPQPASNSFSFPLDRGAKDTIEGKRAPSGWRLAAERNIANAEKWSAQIAPPAADSPSAVPQYSDHSRFSPAGGMITDNGIIIYGGEGKIYDENGNFRIISLENSLLCSDSSGLFFGKPLTLPKSAVRSVAAHPQVAFCSDGIRSITIGKGLTLSVGKFLSNSPAISPVMAESESGSFFISSRGVQFISVSSKISTVATFKEIDDFISDNSLLPDGSALPQACEAIDAMRYDHPSDSLTLFLRLPGVQTAWLSLLFDIGTGKFSTRGLTVDSIPVTHNHHSHIVSEGRDAILRIHRELIADQAQEGAIYLRTRPLKLGDPFKRKSIMGIDCDLSGATALLEASDDLTLWHVAGEFRLPVRVLHLPLHRYHRISLRKDSPSSGAQPETYPRLLALTFLTP